MAIIYLRLLGDYIKKGMSWAGQVRMRIAYEFSAG
jgi:hypothetical protein